MSVNTLPLGPDNAISYRLIQPSGRLNLPPDGEFTRIPYGAADYGGSSAPRDLFRGARFRGKQAECLKRSFQRYSVLLKRAAPDFRALWVLSPSAPGRCGITRDSGRGRPLPEYCQSGDSRCCGMAGSALNTGAPMPR